jgi:hypothetical protein
MLPPVADDERQDEASAEGEPETDDVSGPDAPETEDQPAVLPGEGTEEGTALRSAHDAFSVGDYVRVRELTEPLFEAEDRDVANAAEELHRRTQIDPMQIGVILACVVVFVTIAYVYVF